MAEVQSVQALASSLAALPPEFVRSDHERPGVTTFRGGDAPEIPVIDMAAPGSGARVAEAAAEWGLFQVMNHGVPPAAVAELQRVGREFFALPQEEKAWYAMDASSGKIEGYGSKLQKDLEGKKTWVDFFFHNVAPPAMVNHDIWPKHPPGYRRARGYVRQGGKRGVLQAHGAADAGAVRAPVDGAGTGKRRHAGGVRRRRAGVPAEDQLLPAVPGAGAHPRRRAAHRPEHAHRPRPQRRAGPPGIQGRPLVRRQVRSRRPHHPHRRPDRDSEQRDVQGGAAPDDGGQGEDADVVAGVRGAAAGARRRAAPAARRQREPCQVQG